MGIETALIVGGLVASAGATTANVIASNNAKNDAEAAATDAANKQQKLLDDQKTADANAIKQKNKAVSDAGQAAANRRAAIDSGSTKGSTILTSPLGVPLSSVPTANKSILGGS